MVVDVKMEEESKDEEARFSFNPTFLVEMHEPSPLFGDRRKSKRLESKHKSLMNQSKSKTEERYRNVFSYEDDDELNDAKVNLQGRLN